MKTTYGCAETFNPYLLALPSETFFVNSIVGGKGDQIIETFELEVIGRLDAG